MPTRFSSSASQGFWRKISLLIFTTAVLLSMAQLLIGFQHIQNQQLLLLFGVLLAVILSARFFIKTRLHQRLASLQDELQQTQQQLTYNQNTLARINTIEIIGAWNYDLEKSTLTWAGELPAILGLASESIHSIDSILACISNEYQQQLTTAIADACLNQQPIDIEIPVQQSRGMQRWVRATGQCQLINNTPMWVEGLLQDISVTHASKQSLQLRDFALNQAPDAIFTLDANGCILSANDTASRIFGYNREEMIGQTIGLLNRTFNMADWPRWWQTVKSQQHHTRIANHHTKSGHLFPVEIAVNYFAYNQQELCILSVKDITERKKHEDAIQHLAYHDSLTNLPNRRLLLDRLHQALSSARRHQHCGALLFIDLDNFKKINDSLGHAVGDIVLKELSKRIADHLREEDTLARIGGDEFVVLLPLLSNNNKNTERCAEDLANKLRLLISRPIITAEHNLDVTASIGAVTFPDSCNNGAEELIHFADTAMYRAKENGRNGVVRFEMDMADSLSRQLNLETQLRTALENNEFHLHFQPQYCGLHQLIGAEALLRWDNQTAGMVSPAEFIPILESLGLILDIGEWVMRQACQQLKRWLDEGLWSKSLTLGVNISPIEFAQPYFVEQVATILKETGVPAHYLDIEITEGTVINNIEKIIETLHQLRSLGVKISIDDFGTGYSSLTYLKRLPIDMVKIDQSFVKDIPHDDSAGAIVNSIISMASHLNLDIIAEGIESLEQVHYLENNDCKKFQGFYFHQPMSNSDFTLLLADNKSQALPRVSNVK